MLWVVVFNNCLWDRATRPICTSKIQHLWHMNCTNPNFNTYPFLHLPFFSCPFVFFFLFSFSPSTSVSSFNPFLFFLSLNSDPISCISLSFIFSPFLCFFKCLALLQSSDFCSSSLFSSLSRISSPHIILTSTFSSSGDVSPLFPFSCIPLLLQLVSCCCGLCWDENKNVVSVSHSATKKPTQLYLTQLKNEEARF